MSLKKTITTLGASPLINGIAAVFSVLAGALASFFTSSIRQSLALPGDASQGTSFAWENFSFSLEALVFWMLVILAAMLFAWSKYSDSFTDSEHRGYLSRTLKNIESMPPDAFLQKLTDEYVATQKEVSRKQFAVLEGVLKVDVQEIDFAIKKILNSLTKVAIAYDGHVERDYRTYLMLYSADKWDESKLKKAFSFDSLSEREYVGTLESFPALSILELSSRSQKKLAPVTEFAFPIPKYPEGGRTSNILPGAPEAYLSEQLFRCGSIDQLLVDVDRDFANRTHVPFIKNFYADSDGKGVRSFISLPIRANKWGTSSVGLANRDIAGVVNIETSDENALKNAANFFWPIAQPFLSMLTDLISLRNHVAKMTDTKISSSQ